MRDVTVHLPGELMLVEAAAAELVIGPAVSRRGTSSPASGRNAIVSIVMGGTEHRVSINANVYLGCDVPHWSPRC